MKNQWWLLQHHRVILKSLLWCLCRFIVLLCTLVHLHVVLSKCLLWRCCGIGSSSYVIQIIIGISWNSGIRVSSACRHQYRKAVSGQGLNQMRLYLSSHHDKKVSRRAKGIVILLQETPKISPFLQASLWRYIGQNLVADQQLTRIGNREGLDIRNVLYSFLSSCL